MIKDTNERITITFNRRVALLLDRLASITGSTKSSIVNNAVEKYTESYIDMYKRQDKRDEERVNFVVEKYGIKLCKLKNPDSTEKVRDFAGALLARAFKRAFKYRLMAVPIKTEGMSKENKKIFGESPYVVEVTKKDFQDIEETFELTDEIMTEMRTAYIQYKSEGISGSTNIINMVGYSKKDKRWFFKLADFDVLVLEENYAKESICKIIADQVWGLFEKEQ